MDDPSASTKNSNWRPIPTFNAGADPAPDGAESDVDAHLWFYESTTTSPKTLRADVSIRAHHCDGRRDRINKLYRLKCLYSDDPTLPGFWFAVNTDGRFANAPALRNPPNPPMDITQPQWLCDEYPYLGFTPTYGGNEGAILSLTRVPDAAIPLLIVPLPGGNCKLDSDVASVWCYREEQLVGVSDMLSKYFTHLPDLRRPPLPSTFPYAAEFSSTHQAIGVVTQARDAFSNLSTHLSFLFSMWRFSDLRYPFSNLRRWMLAHEPHTVAEVDELVRCSNVGDFRIGTRAGYLVDLFGSGSKWIPFLHVWAEAGVPLWIYAGTQPDARAAALSPASPLTPAILDWVPKGAVYNEALAKYHRKMTHGIPTPNSYHFEDHPPQDLKLRDVLSPSEIYTQLSSTRESVIVQQLSLFGFRDGDYCPGMSPEDYFGIRWEAIARWREEKGPLKDDGEELDPATWDPKFNSVSMCVWELERGAWRRRLIDTRLHWAFFNLFSPGQRSWDPLTRTLDLCEWLDSSWKVPSLCVFRKVPLDSASRPPPFCPSLPSAASNNPPAPPASVEEDEWEEDEWEDGEWEDGAAHFEQSRAEHFSPPTALDVKFDAGALPSLSTILKDRLGYDPTRPLFDTKPAVTKQRPAPLPLERALIALGVSRTKLPTLSAQERDTVLDAVGTLLLVGTTPAAIGSVYGPSNLPSRWDISPLRDPKERPRLRTELAAYPFSVTDWSKTLVHLCVLGISSIPIPQQYWVLVVEPSTLTQIARANLFEIRRIARYFIQQGISFQLAVAVKLQAPPVPRSIARQGVGSFTDDEPFTVQHYNEYVRKLNNFLASRRGALALRCGGVVWRLAIEAVNSKMVQAALEAPTRSAIKMGGICGSISGHELITDQLEPHELDLILGAHRYRSRNPRTKNEWNPESIATIWPTRAAWAKSSFNTGEWSETSEEWFQQRRRDLEQGKGEPMSAMKWKRELRKQKETRLVWKRYDSLVVQAFL